MSSQMPARQPDQSTAMGAAHSATSEGLFDAQIPGVLKALIDRYGVGLLGEASRLRGLLQDDCPHAKKEISVLIQALEERVPQDLMRVHSGEPIQSLSPRLAKRLADEKAMSEVASHWAVHAWAQGLGVESAVVFDSASAMAAAQQRAGAANLNATISAANESHLPISVPVPPQRDWVKTAGLGALVLAAVIGGGWWTLAPKMEVTRVDVQGPVVGNGKAHPVFIDFQARNITPRSVEVKFVRGDGTWSSTPTKVDIAGDAAAAGHVPAGVLQTTTLKPLNATFEYTLVGADGKRSAPFERSFEIVPPVTITAVKVPKALPLGREFALAINYQKGPADIVQVERRVIESNQPWAQKDVVQQVKLSGETGNLDYKFEAMQKPVKSTLEFVMVDAQGVRSEPYRVTLNVGAPPPPPVLAVASGSLGTVASVQQVHEKAEATGLGAVIGGVFGGLLGNQIGGGKGKTVTTVAGAAGGAYAGHQVEKNVRGGSAWNTTVRLDNGSTQVIRSTTAPGWRVGQRVKFNDGVLSAAK